MAREKSKPDRDLEDGEMLTEDQSRILSAAFVAHMGKGFSPITERGTSRKMLSSEIYDLARENPELTRLLAIRLWKTALLGRGKNAIAATNIILDRMEGPVKAERSNEMPTVEVNIQTIKPSGPREIEATEKPLEIGEMYSKGMDDGRRALRREYRKLPEASELMADIEALEEEPRGEGG